MENDCANSGTKAWCIMCIAPKVGCAARVFDISICDIDACGAPTFGAMIFQIFSAIQREYRRRVG